MKRLLIKIACLVAAGSLLTSCDLFKLDNYDGPNAQVSGRILDAKTNETIQVETYTERGGNWWAPTTTVISGSLTVIEDVSDRWGENFYEEQDWFVKFWGEYQNDMVFAGKYSVDFRKLPVFSPAEQTIIQVNEGANSFDFKLTPYCRIIDPEFSYDAENQLITATFSVEMGDPSRLNTISQVVLCSNTSNFVGQNFRRNSNDTGSSLSNVEVKSDGTTDRITLTIDASSEGVNKDEFQYESAHYLRIGALAKSSDVNTSDMWNFSPVYVMNRDKSINLYDWSTAN